MSVMKLSYKGKENNMRWKKMVEELDKKGIADHKEENHHYKVEEMNGQE